MLINGKRFELEIQNFWQSRWSWKYHGSEIITFTSNEFITKDNGEVELFSSCTDEVEVLILLGLYVRNQFILFLLLILMVVVVLVV